MLCVSVCYFWRASFEDVLLHWIDRYINPPPLIRTSYPLVIHLDPCPENSLLFWATTCLRIATTLRMHIRASHKGKMDLLAQGAYWHVHQGTSEDKHGKLRTSWSHFPRDSVLFYICIDSDLSAIHELGSLWFGDSLVPTFSIQWAYLWFLQSHECVGDG